MRFREEVRTSFCSHALDNKQQEGLLILNPMGRIIYATRPVTDFFNVRLANITGKLFTSLFPSHEQQHLLDRIHHLKPNTVARHRTTKGRWKDSDTHTFVMHPIASHDRILMIIVNLQNTRLLDQLRFERDLLLERERICKEAISHHFFNPLAIAKGYLHLASNKCDDDIKDMLSAIDTALDRIEKTVKTVINTGDL